MMGQTIEGRVSYTSEKTTKRRRIDKLIRIATQVRRDVLRMTYEAESGHPGGALGCADFMVALYFEILNHSPMDFNIDGKYQDIFILSNGHISPVLYSVLARTGYFNTKELGTFRKLNSRLQGHPSVKENLPGIHIATGSLGQGLSVSIGAALAKKLNKDDNLVYTLLGDGELQEGQNWEAAMFASHHKIDNLIATVDYNKKQIDGNIDEVMSLGNLVAKWKAFDWEVLEMNGNNMEEVITTLYKAKRRTGKAKPVIIIMHTIMGYGVDFMEDDHRWHGVPLNKEQLKKALSQLDETLGDY